MGVGTPSGGHVIEVGREQDHNLISVLGLPDSLKRSVVGNWFLPTPEHKNLVGMFHENDLIIPKPIWDSILTAIMERDFTKGNDTLVTRPF